MYAELRILIVSLFILGCSGKTSNSEDSVNENPAAIVSENYIYLSHTRLDTNDGVYSKIYDINFDDFDMTLLGGDLAEESFENNDITAHLNAVFDLTNKNTLWSIGNHDRTTNQRFREVTNKNKYHFRNKNDIAFITLDSQDSLSSIVGAQKEFLFGVLDTVSSKSIVVLSHKLIFMNEHPFMDPLINTVCNGKKGDCYYCHNDNNFQSEIYPKFLDAKNRGIDIYFIGGDLGYKTSTFEYIDTNDITFLGNGIWYLNEDNQVLLLNNTNGLLTYNFAPIDTLIN